jgi:hypothetical protein
MLPPLPKKALKRSRVAIKRTTIESPKWAGWDAANVATASPPESGTADMRNAGFIRRGRPYLTVRARNAGAPGASDASA